MTCLNVCVYCIHIKVQNNNNKINNLYIIKQLREILVNRVLQGLEVLCFVQGHFSMWPGISLHGLSLCYIADLLVPYEPACNLRSSNKDVQCVPELQLKTNNGNRVLHLEPLKFGMIYLRIV